MGKRKSGGDFVVRIDEGEDGEEEGEETGERGRGARKAGEEDGEVLDEEAGGEEEEEEEDEEGEEVGEDEGEEEEESGEGYAEEGEVQLDGEGEEEREEGEAGGGVAEGAPTVKSVHQSRVPGDSPSDETRIRPDRGTWKLVSKHFCMLPGARATSCDFLAASQLLVVGFSTGVFGLYQLPDFTTLHLLSISQQPISTVGFNEAGDWIVAGCAKLGQLLVWEWRSETYVMKTQGHYYDVNCLAFSPDGTRVVTGADDNKVKVREGRMEERRDGGGEERRDAEKDSAMLK